MDFSRRRLLLTGGLAAASIGWAGCTDGGGPTLEPSHWQFPTEFSEATLTVGTEQGAVEVEFRQYGPVTYVLNPSDANYQSLVVWVPTKVAGSAVDASSAPILLNIPVRAYLASPVIDQPADRVDFGGDGAKNSAQALAAGMVVVTPGVRGRDNQTSGGSYFGKAPAAIIDLKAAVRYIRAMTPDLPGNTDQIIASGISAGGALSALLGASADHPDYQDYLTEVGAAETSDAVFAVASYCPIADLENADGAYEWMFGQLQLGDGGQVNQATSETLRSAFVSYQDSLAPHGADGFGPITCSNLGNYLAQTYLRPAATNRIVAFSHDERVQYLTRNSWISWEDRKADFSFDDFIGYIAQREKTLPAFDAFDLSAAENSLFGSSTTEARHFTEFSLQVATGDQTAAVEPELAHIVNLMNPMYFLRQGTHDVAKYWWLRVGTRDTDTSLSVFVNLAAIAADQGADIAAAMYWDAGHAVNEDPQQFIAWIQDLTGYRV